MKLPQIGKDIANSSLSKVQQNPQEITLQQQNVNLSANNGQLAHSHAPSYANQSSEANTSISTRKKSIPTSNNSHIFVSIADDNFQMNSIQVIQPSNGA